MALGRDAGASGGQDFLIAPVDLKLVDPSKPGWRQV
jgi:hypothetical protein